MLKVYHGPMLVLIYSLFGQNSDLKLPGHSRLVLAHDWIYHSLLWLWILFYTLYVCIFSIHRANGMINSVIKDVKGEGTTKNDYKTLLFLCSQMWPLAFELCISVPALSICTRTQAPSISPRGLSRFLWYFLISICFFLTSVTSPYCIVIWGGYLIPCLVHLLIRRTNQVDSLRKAYENYDLIHVTKNIHLILEWYFGWVHKFMASLSFLGDSHV